MSEKLNKVIANLPQSFTTAEQKQARDNIGAQKAISYGYSASSITSIDGSAVGNPASITGVTHDYNLSGSGTSASPLGLNDPINFSGQGTAESSKVSGASAGYRGFRIEVPSAWTANMGHNGFKANYELPSAEDTAGLGHFMHGELDPGFFSLSSHDSQYIEHNVITASVNGRPWMGMYAGYQSGSNQTSIVACVGDANRVDPYLLFGFGGSSEYVDQSSIRRWNGVTAKQDASAMSSYVPFSSISGSAGKVTAINGSAISAGDSFSGVSAGNGISGNGTSGSPLGLNSSIELSSAQPNYPYMFMSAGRLVISSMNGASPSIKVYRNDSSYVIIDKDGIMVEHTASGIGDGATWNKYGEVLDLSYNAGEYYLRNISSDASGLRMKENGHAGEIAVYGFGSAKFTDDSGSSWETVNASAIRKWNSGVFPESSNPLSYGYGGNQASAASQYNVSAGNWAARTLKASGIPDMTLYGFQNLPPTTGGPFMVNAAGAFVEQPLPTFNLKVYKPTTQPIYLSTSDYPKMPATADGLLIIVNRGAGPYVTYADSIGATATIPNNNSAQLIWDCQDSAWVRYNQ